MNPNHIGALEYYGEALVKMGRIDQAKQNLARLETLCGMAARNIATSPTPSRPQTLLKNAVLNKPS